MCPPRWPPGCARWRRCPSRSRRRRIWRRVRPVGARGGAGITQLVERAWAAVPAHAVQQGSPPHPPHLTPPHPAPPCTPTAPFLDALPEELPGCEGNAFYALHRWGFVLCLMHWQAHGRQVLTEAALQAAVCPWALLLTPHHPSPRLPPAACPACPRCAAAAATTAVPPTPRRSSASRTRTAAVRGAIVGRRQPASQHGAVSLPALPLHAWSLI